MRFGCIHVARKVARSALWISLVLGALPYSVAAGEVARFQSQELVQAFDDILICDVDGNGLDDVILVAGRRLVVHLHRAGAGISLEPDLEYACSEGPVVVWPARAGPSNKAALLMMTARGVSALTCTAGQFTRAPLLDCRTVLPDKVQQDGVSIIPVRLSAGTRERQTAIFVPTKEGLAVWREQEGRWSQGHTLKAVETTAELSFDGAYVERTGIDLSIGDLNADGLEDLVTKCVVPGQDKVLFSLYLQTPDGSFGPEPWRQLQAEDDAHTWFGFSDIDKDGQVDLIKGVWSKEPWFLPGSYSGRVVMMVERPLSTVADQEGARQYFRKCDWCPSVPMVDIDGDGLQDLVLGNALLSIREDVRKALLALGFDHSLRIHFNRKDGGFPQRADCQKDVVVRFDARSVHLSWTRKDYLDRLMTLDGDFNGDKMRDLLIRDRPEEASVYFFRSREAGFSRQADMTFPADRVEHFKVADLNGDGVSDLLVVQTSPRILRVFLSNKGGR